MSDNPVNRVANVAKGSAAVPEPSALVLLLIGAVAFVCRHRSRRVGNITAKTQDFHGRVRGRHGAYAAGLHARVAFLPITD